MKPKAIFTAEEFATITDEEIKGLYVFGGEEGKEVYSLDPLKAAEYAQKAYTAKGKALGSVQALKDQLTTANGTIQTITDGQREALENAGEYESLYRAEVSGRAADKTASDDRVNGILGNSKKKATASAVSNIVSELFTDEAAEAMAPFVKSRISTEYNETTGEVTLVPLDPTGKPSGQTVEDFKASLRSNEKFGIFLKGEGNSGGGGAGGAGGGAGGAVSKEWAAAYKPESVNLTVQNEVMQKNPALHKKLSAEHSAAVMANIGKNRVHNTNRV